MTQWKVGDRAEVIAIDHGMKDSVKIGDIATVIGIDTGGDPIFDVDNAFDFGWGTTEDIFIRLPSSTYETIQINGKLYNLVPVEA